mmetsp:Transcript_4411/g.7819  ORF Transcript_4411/g.7819 Transcript_4411/m.7819 type:complete len:154 (+) Transcript_4411:124-585(+)
MATVTAKATAKRITKEAVAALLLFFADARWPLNTPLPQGKLGKDLAAIAQEHGLEKSQIARQLKNFKDKKYRLKDIVLEMTPEQIEEVLEEGIGMEYSEFVCSVLTTLCNTQRNLGNRDINIFFPDHQSVSSGCIRPHARLQHRRFSLSQYSH